MFRNVTRILRTGNLSPHISIPDCGHPRTRRELGMGSGCSTTLTPLQKALQKHDIDAIKELLSTGLQSTHVILVLAPPFRISVNMTLHLMMIAPVIPPLY